MAFITNKIKNVTGTNINITDATNLPVYNLKLTKESTQSGTPSPTNPQQIITLKNNVTVIVGDGNNTENYTISLGDNEIAGIDTTLDELIVDRTGHVYLNKKIGKIVFTGDEEIEYHNDTSTLFEFSFFIPNSKKTINNNNVPTKVKCNYLKSVKYTPLLQEREENSICEVGNSPAKVYYFNIPKSLLNTTSTLIAPQKFKEWLQNLYENNTPMVLYYYLSTPQLIDLNTVIDISLFEETNNVTTTELCNINLEYYSTDDPYTETIYGQDAKHKLKIYINGVDYETITSGLQDADDICEKMTVKSRIIPFGSKVFRLENFISKEVELILHDIDTSILVDPIAISLGTYIEEDEDYEYVPIGIFNLQEKPTTDKNKTTITLRDNSVKFDFNYNAQPLIDENGGSATKLQILQDICEQAGVTCNISSFIGSTDPIGIYDNTKTGRQYISYIAGQGGAIPTINREGELIFIYINNLTTVNIPFWYVESYKNGDKFKISRVVYESGIIKYESGTDTYDTLYLDASNPYVSGETQVANILNIVDGFEINSFSTGKILGNPAIDSYDLISIYDEDTDTTYITFACNELVYNGVLIQKFDSEISLEGKKENVTNVNNPDVFKKWALTEIDNVEAQVRISTGKVDSLELTTNEQIQQIQEQFDGYTPINTTIELERSVEQLQTDTYTKIQIDTKLTDGSVTKLKSTLVTTDDTGTTWDKSDSNVKTNVDADGLEIIDKTGASNEVLLEAKYDTSIGETKVRAKRISVEKYLIVGTHSRFEDYENGTGCFYLR